MPEAQRLKDKIALITGGARGIGKAIGLRFAEEGADVIIADVDMPAAEQTATEITAKGRKAKAYAADVSVRDQVEKAVEAALRDFDHIDILVNNAGIVIFESLLDCSEEAWRRQLDVDLTGAFFVTQIVGRHMVDRGQGGRMIFNTSAGEKYPAPYQIAYCVAKAGMNMLAKSAAMEFAPHNITVNCIASMGALTDINKEQFADPEVMRKFCEAVPLGRIGTVEEIAGIATFLASEDAAYTTGATIPHDGGIWTRALWYR